MSTENPRHYQVVGVDGSEGSKHALAWAIAHTDALGPVEPVSAWHYPWWAYVPTATGTRLPMSEDEFADVTTRLVDQSLEGLDRSHVLEPVIVHGSAGQALLSVGSQASLIVVGTRGHGTLASGLLGSVSSHCANNATVPVAIIPQEAPVEDTYGVALVGYDGSEDSDRAVAWAANSTPPETKIHLVNVWNPVAAVSAGAAALATEQMSTDSLAMAKEAAEKFHAKPEFANRHFVAVSESGDPRDVLRDLSKTADVVVAGARGHGVVAHLLLGSVASALVHHPLAATVVVR